MNSATDQYLPNERDRISIALSNEAQALFLSSIKGRCTRELIPLRRRKVSPTR